MPEDSGSLHPAPFGYAKGSAWAFRDKVTGKTLIRLNHDIHTYRHIKILGEADPFDSEWNGYFQHREKLIKMKSVSNYIGKVSKQQGGKRPHCQQLIQIEEKHHLYHCDSDKTNRGAKNILMLHKTCKNAFEYI